MNYRYLRFLFNLHRNADASEKIFRMMHIESQFPPSKIWSLLCAIVIGCIGLNVNNSSVLIGAMLIEPFLEPLLVAGFALAIFDFSLLRTSLKNLSIASFFCICTSTLYFILTPFKEARSEILLTISPSIYDIVIAFLGGIAAMVAITRLSKGYVVAGVALATSLMIPLCSCGYFIAVNQWAYVFKTFFLFFINCVFISLGALLISKLMHYVSITEAGKRTTRRMKYIIALVVLLLLIPSTFFAYQMYQKEKISIQIANFIQGSIVPKGYVVLSQELIDSTNPQQLKLAIFKPHAMDTIDQQKLSLEMSKFGLKKLQLIVSENTPEMYLDFKNRILADIQFEDDDADVQIGLQKRLASYQTHFAALYNSAKKRFPQIKNLTIGKHVAPDSLNVNSFYLVTYAAPEKLTPEAEKGFSVLLKKYFPNDSVLIVPVH